MLSRKLQAVVLAAGRSKRFNAQNSKLLEVICGKELILYPLEALESMNIPITVVVGYQQEQIKHTIKNSLIKNISFVEQTKQRGTGDALLCSKSMWHEDNILIINGDMPLVTTDLLEQLYSRHIKKNAAVSFVVAHNADPSVKTYGRIVRNNKQISVVEAKEFEGDAHQHCCLNGGVYLVKRSFLLDVIDQFASECRTDELYITDIISIASKKNYPIEMVTAPFDTIRGVNTLQECWDAKRIKQRELAHFWSERGVTFAAGYHVYLDSSVSIGKGTFIGVGVHLVRGAKIGENCQIEDFCFIEHSTLEDEVVVRSHTIIKESTLSSKVVIGPFAHLHTASEIGQGSMIGNFVEVKQTRILQNTKAKHLSYLGNALIGSHVTVGAGTITCNYDGVAKQNIAIQDGAFIGSNSSLVAPLIIGEGAVVGAGSVITDEVPPQSLAIARSHQVTKKGYAPKLREKIKKKHYNKQHKNEHHEKEFGSSADYQHYGTMITE